MMSYQFFWSSVVPSKIPVTSPAAADVLASINTSALASPARARHQKESGGDEDGVITFRLDAQGDHRWMFWPEDRSPVIHIKYRFLDVV